jgi:hypothetical protein
MTAAALRPATSATAAARRIRLAAGSGRAKNGQLLFHRAAVALRTADFFPAGKHNLLKVVLTSPALVFVNRHFLNLAS